MKQTEILFHFEVARYEWYKERNEVLKDILWSKVEYFLQKMRNEKNTIFDIVLKEFEKEREQKTRQK